MLGIEGVARPELGSNPFVAPKDGRCLINSTLPTELLSYVFEIGTFEQDEDENEDNEGHFELDLNSDSDDPVDSPAVQETLPIVSDDGWVAEDGRSRSQLGRKHKDYEDQIERTLPFQVLVSHVCNRWREVALADPPLWSMIGYEGQSSVEPSKTFLERAQNVPLTISVDCSIEEYERDDDDDDMLSTMETAQDHQLYKGLKQFLELIRPHASHFRSLEIMVSHYLLMQLVLETLGACSAAPLLDTLQLYFYEEAETTEAHFEPTQYREQNFVLFQGEAPNLKNVAFWGVHLDWARSTFLCGLVELELAYHAVDVRPSYRDFLRILSTSPNLRCLSLCQSGPAGGPVEWLESVTAGSATLEPGDAPLGITLSAPELVLAFLPLDYVHALLDRISLPNVTDLTLDFDEDDYTGVLERIVTPATGNSKSMFAGLQALKITGLPCADMRVISKALLELQNLREVNINFNYVDLTWLRLLSHPDEIDSAATDKTVYCPRLECIYFSGLEGSHVHELVEAREARGCPLKQVYLNKADSIEDEDEQWLKEHLEGLHFFENSDDEDDEDDDDIIELDVDDDDSFDGYDFDGDLGIHAEDDGDEEWTDETDSDDESDF